MKTNTWHGRFGSVARVGIAALTLAFAVSAFAHPNTSRNNNKRAAQNASHKGCYVVLSSSPFPQPCDRLSATPATASPMVIIGEPPPMQKLATR